MPIGEKHLNFSGNSLSQRGRDKAMCDGGGEKKREERRGGKAGKGENGPPRRTGKVFRTVPPTVRRHGTAV